MVSYIEANFRKMLSDPSLRNREFNTNARNVDAVAGLVRLLDEIPGRLLTFGREQHACWIAAVEGLRRALQAIEHISLDVRSYPVHGVVACDSLNVMLVLRDALAQCPDELPAPEIAGLEFIEDAALRADLSMDIDHVRGAFARDDFKSATVIAGAVVEALLLWGIQKCGSERWEPAAAKKGIRQWTRDHNGPEHWSLEDYLKIVPDLDMVGSETLVQCKLAQGFRNLIHPGRQQRKQFKCDRGMALSTEAALEHVVRDLTAKFDRRPHADT